MMGVRDEYDPTPSGRQRLTVWSPPFASVLEAHALELPRRDGYMLTTYNGDKVRVTCPSPRTADNYDAVDDAITTALAAHYDAIDARPLVTPEERSMTA